MEANMPIDIAQPPPASISSLSTVLPKIAGNRGIASKAPLLAQGANRMLQEQGASNAPTPMLSSPVYVLGLDAIVAGRDLSAAKLAMWTHFFPSARDGDDQLMAADVNADTSRFASLKEGPQVRAFYRQVQALQQAPDIGLRSFELAQLRIPALHVKAVWLKDKGGTSDVVIPIAPTDPALTPGRRYSVRELLAALRPAAETAIAHTDPLKGGQ
jgi:hypothetical protein